MFTPASPSFRKAFAPAPATFSMRIVRAGRSLYSMSGAPRRALAPPQSAAVHATRRAAGDDRARARGAVCRTTHDDVHATSSHGLTETGQLTGPVLELASE